MLDLSQPLVVASLTSDLVDNARKADERGADAVEVRLDLYDGDSLDSLGDLYDSEIDLPTIATNRPMWEGGEYDGDERDRIDSLGRAAEYADAVDIELNATESAHDEVLGVADDTDTTVIVSYHDFDSTPSNSEMRGILSEASEVGDLSKLAVHAETRDDVLRLLEATVESEDDDVCTIAMGETGSHSRVVAPLYGSRLTYASLGDEATAPGQLTVSEVRQILDILLR